jgi:hypothetical protein
VLAVEPEASDLRQRPREIREVITQEADRYRPSRRQGRASGHLQDEGRYVHPPEAVDPGVRRGATEFARSLWNLADTNRDSNTISESISVSIAGRR